MIAMVTKLSVCIVCARALAGVPFWRTKEGQGVGSVTPMVTKTGQRAQANAKEGQRVKLVKA